MESVQAQCLLGVSLLATWKAALNWFFKAGQKSPMAGVGTARRAVRPGTPDGARGAHARPDNVMADVPSLGAADAGTQEWERRVIQHLRTGHYRNRWAK